MSDVVSEPRQSRATRRPARVNLFGLDREAMASFFKRHGESAFRAKQVMQWIYARGVTDFSEMTDLSKKLRERLPEIAEICPPTRIREQSSRDGTRKWLLAVTQDLDPDNAIEAVYIPEADRATLCISSQIGCALDCSFCATGKQGLNRNLTTAEIIGQVWMAEHDLRAQGAVHGTRALTNIVFMGMGEPLANYREVIPAIRILLDDYGFGLSKRRVTVSTSGLVPFMDRLREEVDVALAVSLHAPNDDLRDELVPINRKYPLSELMSACDRYIEGKERRAHVVYEYVLLAGVNDQPEHARELVRLLGNRPAKINLIPFNPFEGSGYDRPAESVIRAFQDLLHARGLRTTVRRTRGDDIDAACGQLVGRVASRQKRHFRDVPIRVEGAAKPASGV
ncbi:23S rRNA (adenine(2503)-C(2))-methyltransferase RlmN [Salinisphaera sp. Q1T1-3]|uniref:23S rRNA (adenine(2503)-C(2))-methyltransferase RlmN n=1 Tax=Salinisphaera sp. Q1T1-3 TaxID=2321229 RepID=UPI000E72E162|nr:23S rRNA (adenine(2503)-C(2))-methyltransferase RlmN [Salinisphaera sp. Q1T1-3]RJS92327.1 23S rRNA (adenine(2503)-C(2))-methyltransferase RlmN [Salinisphaera sp. Q1T1-3]